MPADKMPKMPPPIHSVEVFTDAGEQKTYQADADYYTADQVRAMYLAGIEDARGCVPATDPFSGGTDRDKDNQVRGQIDFRNRVLANLDALGRE